MGLSTKKNAIFCQLAKTMDFFTVFGASRCLFFVEKVEMYKKIKKIAKTPLTRGEKGGKIVEPQNGREAERTSERKSKKF